MPVTPPVLIIAQAQQKDDVLLSPGASEPRDNMSITCQKKSQQMRRWTVACVRGYRNSPREG